uniref:Carboxylesterase type B domain-containing protein n=1 Tax=Acrobeloides nanus TaxID=290746 RepID=A0A914CD98_9BILA
MNAGFYDIIESLRWIQEEISVFGGNAKRVTAIGHSGGSLLSDNPKSLSSLIGNATQLLYENFITNNISNQILKGGSGLLKNASISSNSSNGINIEWLETISVSCGCPPNPLPKPSQPPSPGYVQPPPNPGYIQPPITVYAQPPSPPSSRYAQKDYPALYKSDVPNFVQSIQPGNYIVPPGSGSYVTPPPPPPPCVPTTCPPNITKVATSTISGAGKKNLTFLSTILMIFMTFCFS